MKSLSHRLVNTRSFTSRLQSLLASNDMTPTELGRKIGVSHTAVLNYLNRKATPNAESLYRLSRVLGTTMDALYVGEPEAPMNRRKRSSSTKGYKYPVSINLAAKQLNVTAGHLSAVLRGQRISHELTRRYQELVQAQA